MRTRMFQTTGSLVRRKRAKWVIFGYDIRTALISPNISLAKSSDTQENDFSVILRKLQSVDSRDICSCWSGVSSHGGALVGAADPIISSPRSSHRRGERR